MCVRYTLHRLDAAVAAVAKALALDLAFPPGLTPRYNVAPSLVVPVVAKAGGPAAVRPMKWGLPSAGGSLLTNARSETMTQLPTFRSAARFRRCIVPANGFYEFKHVGRAREPYLFTRSDDEPLALAGLWEPSDPEGLFCVVTTAPNDLMRPIHHRMPVVLAGEGMARWLGDQPLADAELAELTRPAPAGLLRARPVNAFVNNSRHEGPRCIADPDPPEPELFARL